MGEVVVSGGGGDVVAGGIEEKRRGTDDKDGSSEVVRWEKFLPRMVLRVLLVEADDSTRHIISALLRKCSYKVDAVPDGLMAWEALKGGPHNIDLILTEVELPSISGYALLTLVMEDDICKKIPVIMMSSQDSISTVLKCMLKGAADFLIKPVRRNELKNLWQHVWRRQPLNVGHIPQDSPNAQYKVEAGSENNSTSDHSSDCAIYSRKRKECSDERSDSQMECRMRSTPSNTEKENKECLILDEKSIIPETKSRDWSTRLESVGASHNEDHNPTAQDLGEEFTCDKIIIQDESVKLENDRENVITSHCPNSEPVEPSGVIDLIGTFVDGPECTYGHLNMHDGTNKFEFTPQLELSLTRFSATDSKDQGLEGRHALNHSNGSAFSWYNNKTLQPLFPTATSKCTDTEFKENVNKSSEQSFDVVCQHNNGGSQKNGANLDGNQESATTLVIGQSAEAELAYQNSQKLIPVSGVRLDNTCNGYIHSSPPVCHAQTVVPLPEGWSPRHASQREHSPFPVSTSIHSNPETQNHENKVEDKVDETAINSVDQNMQQHNKVEVVEEARPGSPVSGYSRSSSMSNSVVDHNNSSAFGSFSNRSDGNASFAVTSEKPTIPESLDDSGRLFVRDGFRGMDAHRSSQREAALTKFRLKRKDRCYEKKVRYQSRKRLAEQRPRVKGQFVRQVQNDASIANANE